MLIALKRQHNSDIIHELSVDTAIISPSTGAIALSATTQLSRTHRASLFLWQACGGEQHEEYSDRSCQHEEVYVDLAKKNACTHSRMDNAMGYE